MNTKTVYKIKTSAIRKIGKFLGLVKNAATVTPEIQGPKDWQTTTQVPACIDAIMQDIGIIKEVKTLVPFQPTTYLYLNGKNASSKILANDSVFTQYDFNSQTHKPITGLMHALWKVTGAYTKASKDSRIKANITSDVSAYAALGLGAMATAIASSKLFPVAVKETEAFLS